MEQEISGSDQGWEPHGSKGIGSIIVIPELFWNL